MRSVPPTHMGLCLSAQMPLWGKELPWEFWPINNSLCVIHNLCLIMGERGERREGGSRRTQRAMGEQMREREDRSGLCWFVVSSGRFHIIMPAAGTPRNSVGSSQSKHNFLSRNQQSLSHFRPSYLLWTFIAVIVPELLKAPRHIHNLLYTFQNDLVVVENH